MLSKEKIENKKISLDEWLKIYKILKENMLIVESINPEPFVEFVDLLLSEIQQLETDKKKLIEKLEEVIKGKDMSDREYQIKRELAQEILSMIKGEKNGKM